MSMAGTQRNPDGSNTLGAEDGTHQNAETALYLIAIEIVYGLWGRYTVFIRTCRL